MNRGPVAEVDLAALSHNVLILRKRVQDRRIIAVVKADAYGHGAREISKNLCSLGITDFAVAYTEEAKILREAGVKGSILVLFDRWSIEDFFSYDLIPVIHDMETALAVSAESFRRGKIIPVHVEIDTGMGRTGILSENALSEVTEIYGMKGIMVAGLMSHFSAAEMPGGEFALQQLGIFNRIRDEISMKTGCHIPGHIANSGAIMKVDGALLDAVRPGLALYGYSPDGKKHNLKPVMKIKAKILAIRTLPSGRPVSYGKTFVTGRKTLVAVIPAGYADGYGRLLSNNAEVLVHGRRVPVIGRVCMDVCMTDITDVEGVKEGDEVVLVGRQGSEEISAHELAAKTGSIAYEVLTSFGRAKREFLSA